MKRVRRNGKIRRTAAFLSAEWKRGIRTVPSFFAALLLTGAILVLASLVFCQVLESGSILPKIRVAVVIPDNDPMTGMATGYISAMESVKSLADFSYMEEEKAMRKLEEGKVSCVILLPENMYASVDSGENIPVRILFRKDSGLTGDLFRGLVSSGVKMLQTSESAIYAMAEISFTYPLQISAADQMNLMASAYFSLLFNRQSIWTTETVSAYGSGGLLNYYTGSAVLAILLLFGIGFSCLYDRADRLTLQMLRRSGIGYSRMAAARWLVMTVLLWLLLLAAYGAAAGWQDSVHWTASVPAGLLLLAASAAAFMHMIYGFAGGEASALIYLLLAVLVFIPGGGLIPPAFLPGGTEKLAELLPTAAWQVWIRALFAGEKAIGCGIRMAVSAGIMWGLGTIGLAIRE